MDISLTWFYMSMVKVILRSKSFQGQIVSVWLSIGKREVGLRLKGILVIIACDLQFSMFLFLKVYLQTNCLHYSLCSLC